MRHNRLWIAVGLVLWIVMAFVGRWEVTTLVHNDIHAIEKADNDFDKKDTDKLFAKEWMTFALATQQMGYEGAGNFENERPGKDKNRTSEEGIGSRIAKEVQKRGFVSSNCRTVVSAKKTIRYYVFGLCKMLD